MLQNNQLADGLGSRLCREIKSNELSKATPVPLIYGDNDLSALARRGGADAFLPKPFDIADFERTVKT
jgi:CheY-like chemotaxis protein